MCPTMASLGAPFALPSRGKVSCVLQHLAHRYLAAGGGGRCCHAPPVAFLARRTATTTARTASALGLPLSVVSD